MYHEIKPKLYSHSQQQQVLNSKQVAENNDINHQLRQIRKIRYEHNMQQRRIFEQMIHNSVELDLKIPQHYQIIANGIPQNFRQEVWTQLLKNTHGINIKLYDSLLQKVKKFHNQRQNKAKGEELTTQQTSMSSSLIALSPTELNKSKSEGYTPSQQINPQIQKIQKWFNTIEMDIPRTFIELRIFSGKKEQKSNQQQNPQHFYYPQQQHLQSSPPSQSINIMMSPSNPLKQKQEESSPESISLSNILCCWTLFRQDIGYRQGMSQIAGYLLIELNNKQMISFQIFCSLITCDVLFEFFTMNLEYISQFEEQISNRLQNLYPQLSDLFNSYDIDYKLFILDWIYNLFTKCFELDTVGKIWDLLLLNSLRKEFFIEIIVMVIGTFEEEIYNICGGRKSSNNEDDVDGNGDYDVDPMSVCRMLKKVKVDEIRQEKILKHLRSYNAQKGITDY